MNEKDDVVYYILEEAKRRKEETRSDNDAEVFCELRDPLIHLAVVLDHLEMLRFLIEDCEGDPNSQESENRNTPLHLAYELGSAEIIEYLTQELHCDENLKNEVGLLPCEMAPQGAGEVEGEDEDEGEGEVEEVVVEEDTEKGIEKEEVEEGERMPLDADMEYFDMLTFLPQEIILKVKQIFPFFFSFWSILDLVQSYANVSIQN